MSPEKFRDAWEREGDKLVRFLIGHVEDCQIPADARTFLEVAGLPESAAPLLDFGPRYAQLAGAREYFEVGSDGEGSPIAIAPDGIVFRLDHDEGFRADYVNKDIATFAWMLVQIRDIIRNATLLGDQDIDPNVLDASWASLLAELFAKDPRATFPESFWSTTIADLSTAVAA